MDGTTGIAVVSSVEIDHRLATLRSVRASVACDRCRRGEGAKCISETGIP